MKISALNMLIKQADPKDLSPDQSHPERNRGINDNNPLVRRIYRTNGWIEPSPAGYFGDTASIPKYNAQTEEANKFIADSNSALQDRFMHGEISKDEYDRQRYVNNIAQWDFARARGDVNNASWARNDSVVDKSVADATARRNIVNGLLSSSGIPVPGYSMFSARQPGEKATGAKRMIFLGSYPNNGPLTFGHENGHDQHLGELGRDEVDAVPQLEKETTAWNLAGIPAGNPVREYALDTYRRLEPGFSDFAYRAANGVPDDVPTDTFMTRRLMDAEAKNYAPPGSYDMTTADGVPVVHDYLSALNAFNAGYTTPSAEFDKLSKPYFQDMFTGALQRYMPEYSYYTKDGTPLTDYEYSAAKTLPGFTDTADVDYSDVLTAENKQFDADEENKKKQEQADRLGMLRTMLSHPEYYNSETGNAFTYPLMIH